MATIKLEITAGATTYTKTKTVSAADLQRLLTAYRQKYIDPTEAQLTDAQVADSFFEELFSKMRRDIRQFEFSALTEIGMT